MGKLLSSWLIGVVSKSKWFWYSISVKALAGLQLKGKKMKQTEI